MFNADGTFHSYTGGGGEYSVSGDLITMTGQNGVFQLQARQIDARTLELTNPGAFTLTWPAGMKWPGGVAPTRTVAGVDLYEFVCRDGTTVRGAQAQKDSK